MTHDLRAAAMFAVVVHGALLSSGWFTRQPASVDVTRGPVSVDIELVPEAAAGNLATGPPTPNPPTPRQEDSWLRQDATQLQGQSPPSVDTASGHGAFTAAQSRGVSNQPPAYPWFARIRGWEGTVVLQVRVESDGRPSGVVVVKSSGYPILDAAAQEAIRHWQFLPAFRNGHAIRSTVELPLRFRLRSTESDTP